MTCKDCIHYDICVFHLKGNENEKCSHFKSTVDIKTEVAREIFEKIEEQIARYSHIHRYAEEARQSTEEYADGTPCEMLSVWEVLSLHKNGWDDYETMNQLEDNIGNIAKSYLLKELEGDIAELKNKYTEEK